MFNMLIERKIVVFLLCIAILIGGTYTALTMPQKLMPDIKQPFITVYANVKLDVDPTEIEEKVVKPIEDVALRSPYVQSVRANTHTRGTNITIQFKNTVKIEQQNEVKSEVEKALNNVAFNLESKGVQDYSSSDFVPLLSLAIIPENIEGRDTLDELEKVIIPTLKKIPSVGEVRSDLDYRQEQLIVELKPEALKGAQKTEGIIQEMSSLFSSTVMGTLSFSGEKAQIHSAPKVQSLNELREFNLEDGTKLSNHVDIQMQSKASSLAQYYNSDPYYSIEIFISKGVSEIEVGKNVLQTLSELYEERNSDWEYKVIFDSSQYIGTAVKELVTNILIGGFLAIFILLIVYRSFRTMLIIGLSIPICILMTILAMDWYGFTLNIVSLIGLGIGTGMIVDACIVVLDNIFRRLKEGEERLTAVLEGTKEVFAPVLSSVLTTVAVFLPIGILEGTIGNTMKYFSFTITFSLLSSLLVAFILVPILSLKLTEVKEGSEGWIQKWTQKWAQNLKRVLEYCLNRKKRTIFSFVLLFFVALILLLGVVPKSFGGENEGNYLQVFLQVEENIDFELSKEVFADASKSFQEIEGVKDVSYSLTESNASSTSMYITFLDEDEATRDYEDIRKEITRLVEEEFLVTSYSMQLGEALSGIAEIQINSSNLEQLTQALPLIKEELEMIPDVTRLDDLNESKGDEKWILSFDEEKLKQHGLSQNSIEQYLSLILQGRSSTIKINGENRTMNIQTPDVYRHSPKQLLELPLDENNLVSLDSVVNIEKGTVEGNRRRVDGSYQTTFLIYFDIFKRQEVVSSIEKFISQYHAPGVEIYFGGKIKQQQEETSMLWKMLVMSIAAVVFILIIQFNSLRQPFVIFLSLPFTVIGVTIGFLVTGRSFDPFAMIGMVMLVGIVVNNSIVLIDFINKNREKYETLREAITQAVHARMRAIMTTTITTVTGLIPMFIGGSESSNFQTPIATSVIFGLIFATIISLILVPVMYELFEGRRERKMREKMQKMNEEALTESSM